MFYGYEWDYHLKPFSLELVNKMIEEKLAINASRGGLVLGRSHEEGGIYFLLRQGNKYLLEGELEGFEYVLNYGASNYWNLFKHINKPEEHCTGDFVEYTPGADIEVLDTRRDGDPKYLICDAPLTIINKHSTKGFLSSLDEINKSVSVKITKDGKPNIIHKDFKSIELRFYDEIIGYLDKTPT